MAAIFNRGGSQYTISYEWRDDRTHDPNTYYLRLRCGDAITISPYDWSIASYIDELIDINEFEYEQTMNGGEPNIFYLLRIMKEKLHAVDIK